MLLTFLKSGKKKAETDRQRMKAKKAATRLFALATFSLSLVPCLAKSISPNSTGRDISKGNFGSGLKPQTWGTFEFSVQETPPQSRGHRVSMTRYRLYVDFKDKTGAGILEKTTTGDETPSAKKRRAGTPLGLRIHVSALEFSRLTSWLRNRYLHELSLRRQRHENPICEIRAGRFNIEANILQVELCQELSRHMALAIQTAERIEQVFASQADKVASLEEATRAQR